MNVCVGGTFSPLHKGHKELIRTAFQTAGPAGSVFIGVASPAMIKKKGTIASFQKRKQAIVQFLKEEKILKNATIQPIRTKFGPAVTGKFDAIIVTSETAPTAKEINRKRSQLGKTPLQIIVIPFVLSDDGNPIRSSRIRQKEIDENGRVLTQE
jgi:pantetheine-phosphate adenylyltransferase